MTCVYWLHGAGCADPAEGYVGVTDRVTRRLYQHNRTNAARFPAGYVATILLTGPRIECLREERRLRPTRGIGWNRNAGGGSLRCYVDADGDEYEARTPRDLVSAMHARAFTKAATDVQFMQGMAERCALLTGRRHRADSFKHFVADLKAAGFLRIRAEAPRA